MMCSNPFRKGGAEYGCGQCLPCRLNRKRLWTTRLMLEASTSSAACFVTLTYNQENYPVDGCLSKRHAQLFLKRLRKAIEPGKLRYYLVGEYGERSSRAHYHAILFGDVSAEQICNCWQLGFCHVGDVSVQSCGYVVSYVTKGLTKSDDPRLVGRTPEFAIMSRKPGLGAAAMDTIVAQLHGDARALVVSTRDVPMTVRTDTGNWPLGRYLRRVMREKYGFENLGEDEIVSMFRQIREQVDVGRTFSESWKRREGKRKQHAYNAAGRVSFSNSKKGL